MAAVCRSQLSLSTSKALSAERERRWVELEFGPGMWYPVEFGPLPRVLEMSSLERCDTDFEPPSFERLLLGASRSVRASALLMLLRVRDVLLEPLRECV